MKNGSSKKVKCVNVYGLVCWEYLSGERKPNGIEKTLINPPNGTFCSNSISKNVNKFKIITQAISRRTMVNCMRQHENGLDYMWCLATNESSSGVSRSLSNEQNNKVTLQLKTENTHSQSVLTFAIYAFAVVWFYTIIFQYARAIS